jgi:transcriptional regulator with XRE-family HTH domain
LDIGSKIKELRTDKDMTLKELSEKSGLSVGFLSQLERGMTTIAVDSLEILAEILEVPLTHFFDIPHKKGKVVLRNYERQVLSIMEGGFIYYNLSTELEDKSFLPKLVEILPQKNEEEVQLNSHTGEEFIYILEGILTLYIGKEKHELYPGDSVHMNSNITHNWANHTNKIVKFIAVNSPNYFKGVK